MREAVAGANGSATLMFGRGGTQGGEGMTGGENWCAVQPVITVGSCNDELLLAIFIRNRADPRQVHRECAGGARLIARVVLR